MASHVTLESDAADLLAAVRRVRAVVIERSAGLLAGWCAALDRPAFAAGATNLAHYLALRSQDLSALQPRLAALGLSSLGRSESRVLESLDAVAATLARLAGADGPPHPDRAAFGAGAAALAREQAAVFGPDGRGRLTRILVTLPARAAEDAPFVADLVAAGADCVRINCAHDSAATWAAMIANVRAATAAGAGACRVLMDLGGPKCRIVEIAAPGTTRLLRGDVFALVDRMPRTAPRRITVRSNVDDLVSRLRPGLPLYVDDGRIGASIEEVSADRALIRVETVRSKGLKLRVDKGFNIPGLDLGQPAITDKDLIDLDFVAGHADIVGCSFAQHPADVALMQRELTLRRGDRPPQPLVLKIETPLAVRNLPELIAQGAGRQPLAVMIARGDLAVELGFGRIGEVQEQILWLCEAAHVPVVWATQVLAGLVAEGAPSRAEATDAAMAQRAECVMLNKGPYLVEAVRFLDDLLRRMDRHQHKKTPQLAALDAWSALWPPARPGGSDREATDA